jgi:hypothetical protein
MDLLSTLEGAMSGPYPLQIGSRGLAKPTFWPMSSSNYRDINTNVQKSQKSFSFKNKVISGLAFFTCTQ